MSGRTAFAVSGVAVAVLGLVVGGVLWWMAGDREEQAVADLARAPVGCDTTLDFDAPGTYRLYVESEGRLDAVAGDCDVPTGNYLAWGPDEPAELPEVTLFDPEGGEVTIDDASAVTYDAGGYRGEQIGSATIDVAGDYVLRAEGPIALNLAIGGDPGRWTTWTRVAAIAAVVVGLIVGGMVLLRSTRAVATVPEEPATWVPGPGGSWPTSPPGHPIPPPTTGAAGVARPPGGPPTGAPSPWATPPEAGPETTSPPGSGTQIPGQPRVPGAPEADKPWAPPER